MKHHRRQRLSGSNQSFSGNPSRKQVLKHCFDPIRKNQKPSKFIRSYSCRNLFWVSYAALNFFFSQVTLKQNFYNDFFRLAVTLTNFRIKFHPLRKKDDDSASGFWKCLRAISNAILHKRKRQQEQRAAKHRQHMQPVARTLYESDSSESNNETQNL